MFHSIIIIECVKLYVTTTKVLDHILFCKLQPLIFSRIILQTIHFQYQVIQHYIHIFWIFQFPVVIVIALNICKCIIKRYLLYFAVPRHFILSIKYHINFLFHNIVYNISSAEWASPSQYFTNSTRLLSNSINISSFSMHITVTFLSHTNLNLLFLEKLHKILEYLYNSLQTSKSHNIVIRLQYNPYRIWRVLNRIRTFQLIL